MSSFLKFLGGAFLVLAPFGVLFVGIFGAKWASDMVPSESGGLFILESRFYASGLWLLGLVVLIVSVIPLAVWGWVALLDRFGHGSLIMKCSIAGPLWVLLSLSVYLFDGWVPANTRVSVDVIEKTVAVEHAHWFHSDEARVVDFNDIVEILYEGHRKDDGFDTASLSLVTTDGGRIQLVEGLPNSTNLLARDLSKRLGLPVQCKVTEFGRSTQEFVCQP